MKKNFQVHSSWAPFFLKEEKKVYYQELMQKIKLEYQTKTCFPAWYALYNAFYYTSYDDVRVIILGQDPYHQPGQAHGLAFSVLPKTTLPASLKNIFLELANDLQIDNQKSGCLIPWAKQGVLLLNATLTVIASKPNSHSKFGWNNFTDNIIKYLSDTKKNLVFILWGQFAISKSTLIDSTKHLIITSAHPSPFSANRGFFGSQPFSKTNAYLLKTKQKSIDWNTKNETNWQDKLKKF